MGGSTSSTARVNGPEDDLDDWAAIDWCTHEDNVRRLRQRIFKATQAGDLRRVRQLQKLMLRSRSNTLISVRLVTQRNAGRRTAGVDGEVALSPRQRMDLAEHLGRGVSATSRSEEHTSELQSRGHLVCRLLLEKKKKPNSHIFT